MVKESSFNDVMRAMCRYNQSQEEHTNDAIVTVESPHVMSNPISPMEGKVLETWQSKQNLKTQ